MGSCVSPVQRPPWNGFPPIFSVLPNLTLFIISICHKARDYSVNKATNVLKLLIERLWLFLVLLPPWHVIFGLSFPPWGSGSLSCLGLEWVTWPLIHLQFWSPALCLQGTLILRQFRKQFHSANAFTCGNSLCFLFLVTTWDQKFRWEEGRIGSCEHHATIHLFKKDI